MKSCLNFDSVKFNSIVVVSSKDSYDWYMNNLYPYYSAVWVYCISPDVIDTKLSNKLKEQIENNPTLNLIIFGVQNYSHFKQIATPRILIMDNIVSKAKLLQLINRSVAEVIVGFCQQWFYIERIPNKSNWTNTELAKKGGIYTLLN